MLNDNLLLLTDSYKYTHHKMLEEQCTEVFSYFESRGGEFPTTVFFGLQYLLQRYLTGQVVTQEKIDEAAELVDAHIGPGVFNRAGWEHILHKHNGYLPLEIRAVPEGTRVPTSNVLVTVRNTDPQVPWLTNFVETLLSQLWYPTTVATNSYYMKQVLLAGLEKSGDPAGIDFKLHDFGCRGVESMESAALGGAAHLVNFKGTDTVPALLLLRKYYDEPMAGFSIPASEHSTITSWGRAREPGAMENMLIQFPTGLVACVSDSYDIYNAITNIWGKQFKDRILARDGTLVIRPDSGEPEEVVPECLRRAFAAFGGTINSKGYMLLPPQVRFIQGDGISRHSLPGLVDAIINAGFSIDNIAKGSGGGLLQDLNRDTCKFAFKCSNVVVDGKNREVWKDPVTQSGKRSKRGRLELYRDLHGNFETAPAGYSQWTGQTPGSPFQYGPPVLQTVFLNGELQNRTTLSEIRSRV